MAAAAPANSSNEWDLKGFMSDLSSLPLTRTSPNITANGCPPPTATALFQTRLQHGTSAPRTKQSHSRKIVSRSPTQSSLLPPNVSRQRTVTTATSAAAAVAAAAASGLATPNHRLEISLKEDDNAASVSILSRSLTQLKPKSDPHNSERESNFKDNKHSHAHPNPSPRAPAPAAAGAAAPLSARRVIHKAKTMAQLHNAESSSPLSRRHPRSANGAAHRTPASERRPAITPRADVADVIIDDLPDFDQIGVIMCHDEALNKDIKQIRALVTTNDKPTVDPKRIDPFLGRANSMKSKLTNIHHDSQDSAAQTRSYYWRFGQTGALAGAGAFYDPWIQAGLTVGTTLYGAYLSTQYNKVQSDYSAGIVKRTKTAFDKLQNEFQRLGESLIVAYIKAYYVILAPDMPVEFQQQLSKESCDNIAKLALAVKRNIRHVETAMKEGLPHQDNNVNGEKIATVVSPLLAAATLILKHSMNVAPPPNEAMPQAFQDMEKVFKEKEDHFKLVAENQKRSSENAKQAADIEEARKQATAEVLAAQTLAATQIARARLDAASSIKQLTNVTEQQARLIEEQNKVAAEREKTTAANLAAVQKHADEQIQKLQKAADEQIKKVGADAETQVALVRATTTEQAKLIAAQAEQASKRETATTESLTKLQQHADEQIVKLQKVADEQIKKVGDDAAARIKQVEATTTAQGELIAKQATEALEKETATTTKITDLRTHINTQITAVKSASDAAIAKIKSDGEANVKQQQTQLANVIQAVNSQIATLCKEMEERLNLLHTAQTTSAAATAAKIQLLELQIEAMKKETEADRADIKKLQSMVTALLDARKADNDHHATIAAAVQAIALQVRVRTEMEQISHNALAAAAEQST